MKKLTAANLYDFASDSGACANGLCFIADSAEELSPGLNEFAALEATSAVQVITKAFMDCQNGPAGYIRWLRIRLINALLDNEIFQFRVGHITELEERMFGAQIRLTLCLHDGETPEREAMLKAAAAQYLHSALPILRLLRAHRVFEWAKFQGEAPDAQEIAF